MRCRCMRQIDAACFRAEHFFVAVQVRIVALPVARIDAIVAIMRRACSNTKCRGLRCHVPFGILWAQALGVFLTLPPSLALPADG